jgi:hypothetical protein
MPLEIHSRKALYTRPPRAEDQGRDPMVRRPAKAVSRDNAAQVAQAARESRPQVKHNWSHDLESFFWLLFWFLSLRVVLDLESSDYISCQQWRDTWAVFVFQTVTSATDEKIQAFTQDDIMTMQLAACLPCEHRALVDSLEELRWQLWNSHHERKPEEHTRAYHACYFQPVRFCLQDCLAHLKNGVAIRLEPYSTQVQLIADVSKRSQPPTTGHKRSRGHRDEESGPPEDDALPVLLPPAKASKANTKAGRRRSARDRKGKRKAESDTDT